jgi:hypothetical protein
VSIAFSVRDFAASVWERSMIACEENLMQRGGENVAKGLSRTQPFPEWARLGYPLVPRSKPHPSQLALGENLNPAQRIRVEGFDHMTTAGARQAKGSLLFESTKVHAELVLLSDNERIQGTENIDPARRESARLHVLRSCPATDIQTGMVSPTVR